MAAAAASRARPQRAGWAGVPRGFGGLREPPRRCGDGMRALRRVGGAAGSSPGVARCLGGLPVRGCGIPPGREGLQSCRAVEVPAGLTGRKEPAAAALPTMSQPIPVQITVLNAQDLKTLKSNLLSTLVRVEYNGAVLGESPKTHVLPDGTAEYDFSTSFECSPDGPNSLDILVQKPLLLTLLEVSGKDKKKPEKITPLAQAVVDLLPLLQGVRSLKVLAPLYAVPASPSRLYPEATAGLEVTVSSKELLLSATQFSSGNLMSITLEAAYSVPEAFTPDAQQNYMVCLQIPAADEKELLLLFKNGILKADGEKEPLPRPKNWPLGPILAPDALNIPESFIVGGPYEDEDGELNKSEDREFRIQAESTRRVVWDTEIRCFLDAAAVAVLQMRIAERRHWPVELCRMSIASGGKGKASKLDKRDEDKQIAFHGVAYVNMMHLLCPGVKQIRGAFRVFNYQDSEVFQKTKVQYSIFRDRRSQLSLGKERLGTSPGSKAAPNKAPKEEKDCNATYSEAGTFLVMEIKLDKPLVPKRLREELVQRVKELIPPRPALPPQVEGAKKVVEDYHKRVTSVAVAILREYHELFGKQLLDRGVMDHETMEEQKRQLNYELNTSGKYFAFKEQLKYSVVRIVREKYLKTTAFETKEELQAFLSELYVYLVDHMHMALNKLLSGEDVSPAPPPHTTKKQLLLFAHEAEANRDLKLASLFHKQRIARDQRSIQAWLDYGAFCLLYEDATKALECFQQAVCLDPQCIQSLLLCGIVSVKLRNYEDAEIFFEDACCLEPSSIIAWTIAGLFYELQNNYIQAERSFREAKKLLRAQLEEERRMLEAAEGDGKKPSSPSRDPEKFPDGSADKPPEVVEGVTSKEEATAVQEAPEAPEPQPPPCTIFMKTVEFLKKFNAIRFVHKALAHELLSLQGGPTCAYYLAMAWTYRLREDFPRCEECLREAVRIDPLNPNVWAQKGHLCYLQRDFDQAKDCYERVISFVEDAEDLHFVYLRLGSIYLDEKEYGRAKHIFLLACDNSASCLTWLGVGIACYRLEEMLEAEDALSEANALNNTNAEVWGYLALICLQGGRQLEAEQCYKYTVKLGLRNDALLQEIRDAQHRFGFGDPSL
ncbi:cilia- and flagella-associated protein 70 isoform X2 [Motacilla alba alba]|uniref:cilia- and flagella-associated protein 70 isoform X2 n=1 Tax=Motacilla alba alba TaxID=1094192 RepID=UPI0018D58A33|nr:cilia- and flagella-associated protein 70 isoform X2 [Motacilla alba alba]